MANPLPSKPGLTGASALSIPKTWDPAWFRGFINNMLKGADVRNAIGTNGINVSGTIASPYATISISGSGGPITGPLTITAPGSGTANAPLTLVGTADGPFNLVLSDGTNTQSFIGFGPAVNGHPLQIGTVGAFAMEFVTNSIIRAVIDNNGVITGWGATAAGLVNMAPDSFAFTGTLVGCTTSPTMTCVAAKQGNVVVLTINVATGTSNTTGLSITGLPASIQSARNLAVTVPLLQDNGALTHGVVLINAASGTLTFCKGDSNTAASWTAAGAKGIGGICTFAYQIN